MLKNLPNPLLPGFNPDPSIVHVDGTYYLVTSSFEYLPGLPVYRSVDLANWTLIGHVATRPAQIKVEKVITNAGVWAPTIRFRDGLFYVIVTVAMSPVGCVIFTATDPAGPWSDGLALKGLAGIDPDLAWDADGNSYVTFSANQTPGTENGQNTEIRQTRVNLESGEMLEKPRLLWSGTLKHPEAPHLYQIGNWWYLVIAEGGTERGHCVSVARAKSPEGPFEPHPSNPVLSARGTYLPIQNTGHADLFQTSDGQTAMVLLGMRPIGTTQAFSPLGRETFITTVLWEAEWPVPQQVQLAPRLGVEQEYFDFEDPAFTLDEGWIGVRALPSSIARKAAGSLEIDGDGTGLSSLSPRFIGRRQRHLTARIAITVDVSRGHGGLGARYGEELWFSLDARLVGDIAIVTVTAQLSGLTQTFTANLPRGDVTLLIEMSPPAYGYSQRALGGDSIRLSASVGGQSAHLATLDGRYWTAETCASFTGRVFGLYASKGTVRFLNLRYVGSDGSSLDKKTVSDLPDSVVNVAIP